MERRERCPWGRGHWSRRSSERGRRGRWGRGGCWKSSDLEKENSQSESKNHVTAVETGARSSRCPLPVSGLVDRGDGGCGGCGVAGVCVSAGEVCVSPGVMCVCVCSSSSAVARRVCPRERATASGRRPSESGIPRAELFQPYRSSAALWWPRAHAHIWNTHRTPETIRTVGPGPRLRLPLMTQVTPDQSEHREFSFVCVGLPAACRRSGRCSEDPLPVPDPDCRC